MKYSFLAYLFLITLASCASILPTPRPVDDKVLVFDQNEELSRIVWDYVTQLKYQKRLHIEHSYVGISPDRSSFTLQFTTQHILELCDARQLLVDVVEGLLKRLNNSSIANELGPAPITASQLVIDIEFESFYGVYFDPFYIGRIKLIDGMSYFYAFTIKDQKLDKWNSHYEAYFQSKLFADKQREAEAKYKVEHPLHHPSVLNKLRFIPPDEQHNEFPGALYPAPPNP